jgi:hypothetical protein
VKGSEKDGQKCLRGNGGVPGEDSSGGMFEMSKHVGGIQTKVVPHLHQNAEIWRRVGENK